MKFFFALMICVSLVGCSWLGLDNTFRNRKDDYQRSIEFAALEVPENLDSIAVGQLYPIPEGGDIVGYQTGEKFSVPRPRGAALSDFVKQVKIQQLGEDVWILTSAPPAESWPRVRSFLSDQGIPTEKAVAAKGIIETGFFSVSDDDDTFQQFLITLSQGVQLNTTEIDIVQRSFPTHSVPNASPSWAETSLDEEKEDWFRKNLANALANNFGAGSASLLGSEIGAASKVAIVTPENDNPYLDMRLNFDRVWASVSYALGSDGFTVIDKSADSKSFVVEYLAPLAKKPSWLRRTFGKRRTPESFRILLEPSEDSIQVHVLDSDSQRMSQRETYVVLERVRANLT